jgi:hypothetical protein
MAVVPAAAWALTVTFDPVSKCVLTVGFSMLTVSVGLTVTRTAVEVVAAPSLSVATAVSE